MLLPTPTSFTFDLQSESKEHPTQVLGPSPASFFMDINNPFPSLKCFMIWSDLVQARQEPMLSADHHHPIPASVLYFSHRNQASLPPEKRNRLIGLAQGILNFTAVLAHGLYPSPPGEQPQGSQSTQLRAVQSRNQKILFHQPEPGFHLCASR